MSASGNPGASCWRRLAAGLCLLYAAGALGLLALHALLPDKPPPLTAIGYVAPYLFAPLLLTLPLALLSRSRAALIGCLVILGLFGVLYGPLFLPRVSPSRPPAGEPLVVMTFNLAGGLPRPQHLVAEIEKVGADVVAVQELVPATATALREGLGQRYPYAVLGVDRGGTGLLSRYPILGGDWFRPAGGGSQALQATLDVNGTFVQVIVVHPEPPGIYWQRGRLLPGFDDSGLQRELMDVAARAASLPGPLLLLGDFNMGDHSRAYAGLSGLLTDAFREAGWGFGFTFPRGLQVRRVRVPGPLIRIDYIFHSHELRARQARVGCGGGSDHCYVVARLVLP